MDLIYADDNRRELGVMKEYELDLAVGDENNFEMTVYRDDHCCGKGYYVYVDNTEYGGVIDAIETNTEEDTVKYSGRTWHGILQDKILCPDSGQDYLTLSGDLTTILNTIIKRIKLDDFFAVNETLTGKTITYKVERYANAYYSIAKMLDSVGYKLKITHSNKKVVLSAEKLVVYDNSALSSDKLELNCKKTYTPYNHVICLGSGELKAREVIHLYSDKNGNVGRNQTFYGVDERATVYDYSSAESSQDLIDGGTKILKESYEDAIEVTITGDSYGVGDIIMATDEVTRMTARASVTKKILSIKSGDASIEYKVGE